MHTISTPSFQSLLTHPRELSPILDQNTITIQKRPRRNRKTSAIRALVQETRLHPSAFVAPLFIVEGTNQKQPINSMPNVYRYSTDLLIKEVECLYQLGIRAIELFPVVDASKKDSSGSEALQHNNLMQRAVRELKRILPEMCVMVDMALDPYTDHGHDGLVDSSGYVLNDATLEVLGKMALHAVEAGADIVAPSDMMDGRIGYIRQVLDGRGFTDVGILAYAAKYASGLYGPFRDALGSAPKFGDKKSYQMNPANGREALMELALDEAEGADMLLIKPAMAYLDIIVKARQQTNLPLGAYHVSGEYAMVMAAAQNGWIDGDRVMAECLLAIKRAGADFILTYAARHMSELIQSNKFPY